MNSEAVARDVSHLREGLSVDQQLKHTGADLKDYSLTHKVSMSWHMNQDAKRNQIFVLNVGGHEVYLDKQEFMRSLRMV